MDNDFASLIGALDSLKGDARKKIERKALTKVGKLVKKAVEERTPERPDLPSGTALPVGALKADIHARVHIASDPIVDSSTVTVGPGKDTMHVANWVENGHALVAGGYSKVDGKGNRRGPGRVIKHIPAYPFIRPAAEAVEEEATQLYADTMADEITKVVDGDSTSD